MTDSLQGSRETMPFRDRASTLDVSVVIISWNTRRLLIDCIASIYAVLHDYTFEIIVVDNASSDGSVDAVRKQFPEVRLIVNSRNSGFAKANNSALKVMRGRYALLLNSDTALKAGAVDRMIAFMDHTPEAGVCGPQLLNGDGSKQASYGAFPALLTAFLSKPLVRLFFPRYLDATAAAGPEIGSKPDDVDFIYGACMLVRRETIQHIGLLDEVFFFFYEETDWCYRMKQSGWRVVNIPDAEVYHYGAQSTNHINLKARVELWRSQYIYFNKIHNMSGFGRFGMYTLGFLTVLKNLIEYGVVNLFLVGSRERQRKRLLMYAYLFIWHVRGLPESMGLPRVSA